MGTWEYLLLAALLAVLIALFTRFHPTRTAKIADNLYAVNCAFVNFYAYQNEAGIALFDAGASAGAARRGLEKLGLSPEDVTRVFLTHTDFDHSGGLSAFPNAEVFISEAEEQMINGETTRRGFMRNKLAHPHKTLQNGETIKHGDASVKLILTPGHTPGSASYLIDGRALATGDLLRLTRSGAVKPFLRLMNKDHKQDAQTVEGMRENLGQAKYILSGHTGVLMRENVCRK